MPAVTGGPPPGAALPRERGGWWHEYVCPAHGVELDHADLFTGVFPKGGAPCRYGCRVDTAAVRGAWLVLSHQAWARRIRLLAHGAARDAAGGEAARLLREYAELYASLAGDIHERAQPWMLRGRLFHQALTDAVWATSIGHAVWTLAAADADARAALEPVLPLLDRVADAALGARAILVEQGRFDSNYTAWLTAAGVVCGRAAAQVRQTPWTGESEWFAGSHGLYAHVMAANLDDGWEWEAGTYYHGFVLRAYLLTLRGTDPAGLPDDVADRLRAMVAVLPTIATEGGILPALHDGPYLRHALGLEWLELCALASQLVAPAGLDAIAAHARREAAELYDGLEDELAGWFSGPPLPAAGATGDAVTVFPTAGHAVVRAPGLCALLDYGPHGGSHGHHDKLSLYLYGRQAPWQPDYGQVPYGHGPLRHYYASAAAHPTFRVDGAEPVECAGTLVRATATTVTASVADAYPGVTAWRQVTVAGGHLVDLFTVDAGRTADITAHLRPDVPLTLRHSGAGFESTWDGPDGEVLYGWHVATVPATPLVMPGPGPADDPQRVRRHVDWTAHAQRVTYCSVYQVDGAADPVSGIRLAGDRLVVTLGDGTASEYPVGEGSEG